MKIDTADVIARLVTPVSSAAMAPLGDADVDDAANKIVRALDSIDGRLMILAWAAATWTLWRLKDMWDEGRKS